MLGFPTENGTVHDADAPDGAASPSRWMQADAAEPDIGSERDITRLGESVVKVGTPRLKCKALTPRPLMAELDSGICVQHHMAWGVPW